MSFIPRKRIWISLVLLVVLGGACLSLPWWLPVAGRPVARHFGVEWEAIRTHGWRSYEARDVRGTFGQVELTIDHLRLPQPLAWLGSRFGFHPHAKVEAGNLRITVLEAPPLLPEEAERLQDEKQGVELLAKILMVLEEANAWIPELRLQHLEVRDHRGRVFIGLEELRLAGPLINGRLPEWNRLPALDLSLLRARDQIRLTAIPVEPGLPVRLQLVVSPALPSPSARAWLFSGEKALEANAAFNPGSWIPDSMRVRGAAWPVPGLLIPTELLDTRGLLLDLDLDYGQEAWMAHFRLNGTGRLPGNRDDRVEADVDMRGSRDSLEISTFTIKSGWLTAHLSDPIHYSLVDNSFSQSAKLRLSMDLSQQEWTPATGILEATAKVRTSSIKRPELEFEASGRDLAVSGFILQNIAVRGSMQDQSLVLESADIDLGEDSVLSLTGTYNLEDKSLAADAVYRLSPEWLKPYTGKISLAGPLTGSLYARGAISALQHRGTVEPVTITIEGLHPLTCALSWQGEAANRLDLDVQLDSATGSRAQFDLGAVIRQPPALIDLTVREAIHEDAAGESLLLAGPFTIELDLKNEHPVLAVSPFLLSGSRMYLSGEYNGGQERISLAAGNLDLSLAAGWMDRTLPLVIIDQLDGSVTGLQEHLEASIDLTAHSPGTGLEALTFRVQGNAGSRGVLVDTIDGRLAGQPFVYGSVSLPVLLHPMRNETGSLFTAIPGLGIEGALSVELTEDQAGEFQNLPFLKLLSGVEINLAAGGTIAEPEAQLEASLDRLSLLRLFSPKLEGYPLQNLRLSASISPDQLQISNFRTQVKGADLAMSGVIPGDLVPLIINREKGAWKDFLRKAKLDLSLKNLLARDFQSLLPGYLRSTGQIDGQLRIRPGPELRGNLQAQRFSLRPTLYSQTVENIEFSLDVAGSRLTLAKAKASIGNSLVSFTGYFDIADPDAPLYKLDINSERTPLIRTPDLLVHADVDLHLDREDPKQPARLSGDLRLRDSTLLLDIEPLAARTAGGSIPKPPFFSIEQAPFSDWILDVDISGDEFLRFRSTYVKTTLSTQLDLTGTLADPVWVGNIFADEGTVDFPGLRTHLSRSELFLTRERQDNLQLDISTIGQVASYILTVGITGSLDDPHVQFASTPDLPNSKIIQLLATGSVEGSNLQNVGIYLGKSLFPAGAGENVWDRLSIQIGRDITETSKDTIDLYYEINERWRLHGEYDKYDAQNLNLEWEVFSR